MILILAIFSLGFITFPLLYVCIPSFIGRLVAKKRYKSSDMSELFISKHLKKEIQLSMTSTSDLGWINVLIQRMYHDMAQNYYFENMVKQSILRSFSAIVGSGLVKNIKIKHLGLGSEAPYLKHIKLISKEEYHLLTEQGISDLKSCAKQISQDLEKIDRTTHTEAAAKTYSEYNNDSFYSGKTINFSSLTNLTSHATCETGLDSPIIEIVSEENLKKHPMCNTVSENKQFDVSSSYRRSNYLSDQCNNEKIPDHMGIKSNTILQREVGKKPTLDSGTVEFSTEELGETNFQEAYRNCTFLGHLVYDGDMKVTIEVELPKGMAMNATVAVKRVISDFLFRMPAENYTTRYEVTLINNPSIEIEVESGLDAGYKKAFFQNSMSNFLKRSALSTIKNTIFYPCWYQIVQPFAATPKSINFCPSKISISNIHKATDDAEKIMAIIGCDFKIVSQEGDIFHRKSSTMLNDKGHISMWDFPVPLCPPRIYDCPFYEGISAEESKLLYLFETFEIFKNIIPGFEKAKQTGKKRNTSLVRIIIYDSEVEFIRVIYKSHVVFYKNIANACEFFVFRIQEGRLQVFNFANTSGLRLNNKRIAKLKRKVYSGSVKAPGSNLSKQQDTLARESMLSRAGSTKRADLQDNALSTGSEDSELCNRRAELESLFGQALKLNNDEFSSYEVIVNIKSKRLKEYLKEDCLRLKMISESGHIVSSFNEARHIKTIVAKDINTPEMTFHSFFSDKFIIDMCPDNQLIFIYRICKLRHGGNSETGRTQLQILYRPTFQVKFPNYFVESLKIRESYQKYFSVCDRAAYLRSTSHIQKEMSVSKGTIYFEFRADVEDDFRFELFSCKRQAVMFDLCKVISNRTFKLVYPVENDYVKISLIPKYNKNEVVEYKIACFPYTKDVLVEGMIGLDCSHKFRVAMKGSHTHVIFWEKEWDSDLKSCIHDGENKMAIGNCGILRSEEREYILTHKNKTAKRKDVQIFTGLIELYQ